MIIYIDKTISEHCMNEALNEIETVFFSKLLNAHYDGKCLLCGDLSSLETLIKHYGDTIGKLYQKIYDHYSEIRSIVSLVEKIIVLSYDAHSELPSFMENKAIVISVDKAIRCNFDACCNFLCENLDDCKFYSLIAERYMYDKNIKGIKIVFQKKGGGGSTIGSVFKECVEVDRVLTLCIADSDIKYGKTKAYPESPKEGETSKNLKKVYNEICTNNCDRFFELLSLPIHEAENLIPIDVLDYILNNIQPAIKDGVEIIHKLVEESYYDSVLVYDFKTGNDDLKSEPGKVYWSYVGSQLQIARFPGVCKKILNDAIDVMSENMENGSKRVISFTIDNYLTYLWEMIGAKMLTWGCVSTQYRM